MTPLGKKSVGSARGTQLHNVLCRDFKRRILLDVCTLLNFISWVRGFNLFRMHSMENMMCHNPISSQIQEYLSANKIKATSRMIDQFRTTNACLQIKAWITIITFLTGAASTCALSFNFARNSKGKPGTASPHFHLVCSFPKRGLARPSLKIHSLPWVLLSPALRLR